MPTVEIDEGQIAQVLNNLIINADQAMPDGGILRLGAGTVEIVQGDPLPLKPGRYLRVRVSDTGIGIPKEALPRIFDPFYTTKEKGSGLGLTTVYSVVRKHEGVVTVESEPGGGTSFFLFLPVPRNAHRREADQESGSGKRRVLVMDDEGMVREVALEFLGHLGYEGAAVEAGDAAIAAYRDAREAGRPFSAVIMDLTIPGGMGGKEAVRRLHDLDPGVRAIVSAGYSNDPVMADPRCAPNRLEPLSFLLFVVEHPVLGALHVVVLIALHRPQEQQPGGESQCQRHEDEQERGPHGYFPPRRSRSEFPTTSKELPAMNAAAAIGWSFPATASGTAARL